MAYVTMQRRDDGARSFNLRVGSWTIGRLDLVRIGQAWRWRLDEHSGRVGDYASMAEALRAMHARLGNRITPP